MSVNICRSAEWVQSFSAFLFLLFHFLAVLFMRVEESYTHGAKWYLACFAILISDVLYVAAV